MDPHDHYDDARNCERCNRVQEAAAMVPHPADEDWLGEVSRVRFCRPCYATVGRELRAPQHEEAGDAS
ncbi:MAG: hypothetical protein AAFQ53_11320 [Bacteroidota bacterium]